MGEIKSDILLESGTNEIQILEFSIANNIYGINVAKIREIMTYQPINDMQKSHPAIEGVFKPRESIITVVNLPKYLGLPESDNLEKDIFIIADFNKIQIAFHVNSVIGIDVISWQSILKPDKAIYGGQEGIATGIAEFEGRLITILDFEKIVADICPENTIKVSDIEKLGKRERVNYPILIAEDSALLSKLIVESLKKAGYENLIVTNNGKEAWDILTDLKTRKVFLEKVSCVITDIEMPQMDGHRLLKLIKDDEELRKLPVVIFSSLINEEMKHKGKLLGADGQISKPEISELVGLLDGLVAN